MTTLYHTLFVGRMYSLEHNNMTAAPVIKGNTSGFLPTGASLSISKWRLREIGVYLVNPTYSTFKWTIMSLLSY